MIDAFKGLTFREIDKESKHHQRSDSLYNDGPNPTLPIAPTADNTPIWVWPVAFISITIIFAIIIGGFAWVNRLDQQRDAQISSVSEDSTDSTESIQAVSEGTSKTSWLEASIESFKKTFGQNERAEAFRGAAQEVLNQNRLRVPSWRSRQSPDIRPFDAHQRIEEMEMGTLAGTETSDTLEVGKSNIASASYGACEVSHASTSRGKAESPLMVAPKAPSPVHVQWCGGNMGM
ncbi:hypothetical protein FRC03_005377 [Tulasnella sp. 419]|nr:hypothetical protein FRC03_005377 [Tulasnella sp. 419]